MGEYKLRDLNDNINKLLREKGHWEDQIKKLGGPDYKVIIVFHYHIILFNYLIILLSFFIFIFSIILIPYFLFFKIIFKSNF